MKKQDLWKRRYREHMHNAELRRIPFLLTFEEWCLIWKRSGKWHERGCRKGQYCMARPGDRGAYKKGNVIICLQAENHGEWNSAHPLNGKANPAYGKDYWASASGKERARRSKHLSNQLRGKPKPLSWRRLISKITKKRPREHGRWCD